MNKLFKSLVYDKQVSLTVLDTTQLVNKAIKTHSLDRDAAIVLGNMLTCCAYMAGCLKSRQGAVSMTIKAAEGDGAISVSGDINLHIRGYVDGTCCNSLKGGTLTVIKDDGFYRPFTGTCEIKCDDVSEIIMQYFHQSEQIPTAVSVGVNIGEDGMCRSAGGVIMQLLPDTSQENMDKAENAMQNFVKAADVVEKFGADGIITNFFGSEINKDGLYLSYPDYICNCSRQKIKNILLTMGKSQLMSIINEQGDVCVHCHYCNTDYRFVKEDIEELFKDE